MPASAMVVPARVVIGAALVLTLSNCRGEPGPPGPSPAAEEVAGSLLEDPKFIEKCSAANELKALEDRIYAVEERMVGIGYMTVMVYYGSKWVNPLVRCNGPQDHPRDFGKKPATLTIKTGYKGREQPKRIKVQVRAKDPSGGPGEIVFDEKVPFDQEQSRFVFEVENASCEEIYVVALNAKA